MKPPRGLSATEAALWRKVTETVVPLVPPLPLAGGAGGGLVTQEPDSPTPDPSRKREGNHGARLALHPRPAAGGPPLPLAGAGSGLDSHWDRRLKSGLLPPDFTLDLHGHSLDQAHRRLDAGLMQAKAMGARLVLLITGNPRPADAADRGKKRGAIRAKVLDWLAAGPHGADIAAVRPAHRRHGGAGALYLVLRRRV